MKYIKITNNGCIEPKALHLVGASTKRNDSTKIGQFGSGNKYALAYLLRNDYEVIIYSGEKRIEIETKPEILRDQEFKVIWIDGERTSITTEMGKDWEFWQAIREIYCNAIDEGGYSFDFVQSIEPSADKTHFYIDTKKDVMEFVSNFDNYFSINKKVLFECNDGKIIQKSGETANIYRKGIRCFNTTKTSSYDYDLSNIDIDENRLVKFSWHVDEKIWQLLSQCTDKEIIKTVLHNCSENTLESAVSDWSIINASNMSEEFKEVLKSMNLAPRGFAGMLKQDEILNHVIIPTKVFQAFRGVIGDENVGDKFKVSRKGGMFREIEPEPLHTATIKKAIDFLNEVDFSVNYPIKIAVFDEKHILGCAHNETIILSDRCVEMGVNEVVNTIIEEYIHLKYDASDETRSFQTAIITEFITYMKKHNSYLI